jgi:hypothetical protein
LEEDCPGIFDLVGELGHFADYSRRLLGLAADPPHKGQTPAVGLVQSVGFMVYLMATGRGDVSRSISLLVFGRRGAMRTLEHSSR